MIRKATSEDTQALIGLAEAVGLFEPGEIDQLQSMLDSHHSQREASSENWLVYESGGVAGVAYFAPERMTLGTWNLYLIAVHPSQQRQGVGATLLQHVEQALRKGGGQLLIVETMGIESFDYVRAFYQNQGFIEEARIRDFYARGQDKVVYWKSLIGE